MFTIKFPNMNDSQEPMANSLVQALSQALFKQLGSQLPTIAAPNTPAFQNIVEQLDGNLLVGACQVQPPSAPPRTPTHVRISDVGTPTCAAAVLQEPGTPISRTSSGCSTVSTCSSVASLKNFESNETPDPIIKRRKRCALQNLSLIHI